MPRLFIYIIAATMLSLSAAAFAASKPAAAKAPAIKPVPPQQVESKPVLEGPTQFDLARRLVEALGFGEGLPEKPQVKDYLEILGGNRTFRFEAEDTFDKQSDHIAVRDYPLLGAFSGKGWLHGTTSQTAVHFKIFIPVSGKYTLKVAAKGDGQLWSIAGKAFKLNSGEKLRESTLGQLFIPAGELEFNAVIPPAGAIDFFVLTAPAAVPVEPLAGWNPSAPLTAGALNEVAAALLGLEPLLPEDSSYKTRLIEAASLPNLPETVYATDNRVLGTPVATKWLRAFQSAAKVSVPLEIDTASIYRIRVRGVGTELTAGFGQRTVTKSLKPYLDWTDLGTFRLAKGSSTLELLLPPTGGIDVIEVSRKLTTPADYAAVAKTDKKGDMPLTAEELAAAVKSLQEQFKAGR